MAPSCAAHPAVPPLGRPRRRMEHPWSPPGWGRLQGHLWRGTPLEGCRWEGRCRRPLPVARHFALQCWERFAGRLRLRLAGGETRLPHLGTGRDPERGREQRKGRPKPPAWATPRVRPARVGGGPLGRGGYLRGPSRRGPRCHLGAGCRRLQAQHRALGPGRPRGRRAADQAGLADVPAGQLAAARARPAALLEQRVGEARRSPAGASVGHRDHVGPLRAPLGLRGKRRRDLPFVGAPRRPGSEEHHAAAQQDSGQDQHGQHGRQHHAAAACGDRPGRLGMEQHLAAGASPLPRLPPRDTRRDERTVPVAIPEISCSQ